jgi:hypothetical protein
MLPNLNLLLEQRQEKFLEEIFLIDDSSLWKEISQELYENNFTWVVNTSEYISKEKFPKCWKRCIGYDENKKEVIVYIAPKIIEVNIPYFLPWGSAQIKGFKLEFDSIESFLTNYSNLHEYIEFPSNYFR